MIYADNAATTKLDEDALNAMLPFLRENYGNASQSYSFSRSSRKALKEARETIASCINATPEQILFTSCGTESDNWVIKGVALSKSVDWKIATSCIEHHAVLRPCKWLENKGYNVKYLSVDSDGVVEDYSLDGINLASIMFANNEIGTLQPIKRVCEKAHASGALFHTDAVQAVGHLEIDVHDLDVDFLSASAHKFNGPKGIGFLYAKKTSELPSFMNGGGQEFGFRAGTENVASIVGMAVALKKNYDQIEKNKKHLFHLENILITQLNQGDVEFIRNGSQNHIPGNVSLSFKNQDGEALQHRLDFEGICVSTGSACDSRNVQISHVLKAIGLSKDFAEGTIRISLGKENTELAVNQIADSIIKIFKSQSY